jgi:hypothetical protein
MKLRMQNDSLRLRLTRSEVAEVRAHGRVEAAIHFARGTALVYALEASRDAAAVSAELGKHGICVTCPLAMAIAWADSDQVSMESAHGVPRVLVEKDFECLHRLGEQTADAYPNPLAGVL